VQTFCGRAPCGEWSEERGVDVKDLGDEIPQSTLDHAGFGTPPPSPVAWRVPKRANQGGGWGEESRVAGLNFSRVTLTEGKTRWTG